MGMHSPGSCILSAYIMPELASCTYTPTRLTIWELGGQPDGMWRCHFYKCYFVGPNVASNSSHCRPFDQLLHTEAPAIPRTGWGDGIGC
ncbi:hypothetical protein J3E74DRAFT_347983 [Bipolaris maydis]|nr:hypothetical protein J3E74DRAFT_347983 [Bipolaris maydis]